MKANILCFLYIWCVVQVTSSEFPDDLIEDHLHKCLEELNLDTSVLSKMFDDNLRMTDLDEDGKNLLECGIKKGELISADGKMNRELLLKYIVKSMGILEKGDSEKVAEEVYEKCDDGEKGEDDIDRIRHWCNCVSDEIGKL